MHIFKLIGMARLIWVAIFAVSLPAVLVWAVYLLNFSYSANSVSNPSSPTQMGSVAGYSTLVLSDSFEKLGEVATSVTSADSRPTIVRNYLSRYKSDLEPLAELIVSISDKYELDFRLLVAIAQQESNLCKRIPVESFNCWGFGIYGDKVTRFSSYEQGLEIVAKTLKRDYLDKGYTTPEKIMTKYTPPSVAIGGPWAKGVNQFLADME